MGAVVREIVIAFVGLICCFRQNKLFQIRQFPSAQLWENHKSKIPSLTAQFLVSLCFLAGQYLKICRERRWAENQEKIKYLLSNLHGFTSAPAVMFQCIFPPEKEEMGWHPTTFSILCCITFKLALHGNKLAPKANKTFLLARDSVILNTN